MPLKCEKLRIVSPLEKSALPVAASSTYRVECDARPMRSAMLYCDPLGVICAGSSPSATTKIMPLA
jgi:hypothetical protein